MTTESTVRQGSTNETTPIHGWQLEETEYLTPSYLRPPLNLPCGDLLTGNRDEYLKICVPLYTASLEGDWETAHALLLEYPKLLEFGITENYDTALHIAASAKSSKLVENFVKNLVNLMTKEQLQLQNRGYKTALCLAAASGNVKTARTMLQKNKDLMDVTDSQGMTPLNIASLFGQREMITYLYDNCYGMRGDSWTDQNRAWVFEKCVEGDLFDVALKILSDHPKLAVNGNVLGILAQKTHAFEIIEPPFFRRTQRQIFSVIGVKVGPAEKPRDATRLLRIIWEDVMKLNKETIDEIMSGKDGKRKPNQSSKILFLAAKKGNTEFLVELIRQYPELLWRTDDNNQTIFHVAVSHRHAGIYNLLREIGSMKDMITPLKDKNGNTILHLVAMSKEKKKIQHASRAALLMQREFLWFKEVEALIPPSYRQMKNNNGRTPDELFLREHEGLLSLNNKWMEETINQCLVVAALVASIGFAAAFAVPGGYNQNNGIPLFLHNRCFIVFAISDAISLTFSCISILIFTSLLTSHQVEHNLLESLYKKMTRGLAAVFFSIIAMLIGFSASFFMLFQDKLIWVPIMISLFISIPVILFIRLQLYDLLPDIYHSTYASKNLFTPNKPRLYYKNPTF